MPRGVSKKGAATPKSPKSAKKVSRTASSPESPKEEVITVTVYEMAFTEGDAVMAKWPGTNLFFKAKVTFVRDDDNEYDVQVSEMEGLCSNSELF